MRPVLVIVDIVDIVDSTIHTLSFIMKVHIRRHQSIITSESESESDLIAAHYSDQYHLRRCSTPAMHTKKAIRKTKNHTLQELLS